MTASTTPHTHRPTNLQGKLPLVRVGRGEGAGHFGVGDFGPVERHDAGDVLIMKGVVLGNWSQGPWMKKRGEDDPY